MRLVLGIRSLDAPGGSESYVVTVAEQLSRLGHDVTVTAGVTGPMAVLARERGLRVVAESDLPDAAEAVIAQDAETAYRLRERYPEARALYVLHSRHFAAQDPPQLTGVVDVVVVMNDVLQARAEAMGAAVPVARLRQPVDSMRFRWGTKRLRARRVLVLGNHYGEHRLAPLRSACDDLDLELAIVGGVDHHTLEPEREIGAADVVVGVGRCVVEAMVGGRAAYVLGNDGVDGWVTPDSYPALEADGFSGRAFDHAAAAEALRADLAGWRPEMGQENSELALRHHDAADHAASLVALLRDGEAAPRVPAGAPVDELARMARMAAALEARAIQAELRGQATSTELARQMERLRQIEGSATYRFAQRLQRAAKRLRRTR